MTELILTNDDGIAAPGIAALYRACSRLGKCVVVAPAREQSGVGHACTTHASLRFSCESEGWYAVDGTPVDCTRLALTHIAPNAKIVVAGINAGGNLGADSYTSGTVAAVREAAFLGRTGIAVSQYIRPRLELDWSVAERWAQEVVRTLIESPASPEHYWSVNFPHVESTAPAPSVTYCGLDPRQVDVQFSVSNGERLGTYKARYSSDYHSRPRHPQRDVDVCFGGDIAVTRIPVDITGDENIE